MIRKRMKVLSLLLVGILSFSLAACGGSAASNSSAGSAGADGAGSAETAAGAASAGEGTQSTEAATEDEAIETGEGTDSAPGNSGELSYKTADYIQEETVLADTDHYKVTVTGFEPDYKKDDQEGFLIHLKVENKEEKEFRYMVTGGSVNHAIVYGFSEETAVAPGESAEMDYLIDSSFLETYKVSSVDAVSIEFQAMSSELSEAYETHQMDVLFDLEETDSFDGNFIFSPTGMDYETVTPPVMISENDYDIITDNDVLTLGICKNEDGTVFDDHEIYVGYMVHTDKTEGIMIEATDFSVDGKPLNNADGDGVIYEDDPYTSYFMGGTVSNVVVESMQFIEGSVVEAYHIEDADTIEFTISIRSEDGSSELYSETFSYSLK